LGLLSLGLMLVEAYGSTVTSYWDSLLDEKGAEQLVGLQMAQKSIQWYVGASDSLLSDVPEEEREGLFEKFLPLKITQRESGAVVHQKGVDARLIADMFRFAVHMDVPVLLLVSNDSDFSEPMKLLGELGYTTLLLSLAGKATSRQLAASVTQVLDYDTLRDRAVSAMVEMEKNDPRAGETA